MHPGSPRATIDRFIRSYHKDAQDPALSAAGSRLGKKGGPARAEALSPARRAKIAAMGARAKAAHEHKD